MCSSDLTATPAPTTTAIVAAAAAVTTHAGIVKSYKYDIYIVKKEIRGDKRKETKRRGKTDATVEKSYEENKSN